MRTLTQNSTISEQLWPRRIQLAFTNPTCISLLGAAIQRDLGVIVLTATYRCLHTSAPHHQRVLLLNPSFIRRPLTVDAALFSSEYNPQPSSDCRYRVVSYLGIRPGNL